MAGWLGLSAANEVLNFLYRGTPISIGSSLYLRLLVAPSSRSGGGTETNYSGYARYELPRDASVFTAAATIGQLTNGIVIEFPSANDAGNGDLVWFDVVDTPSGAFTKLYPGGPISPAKAVAVGKPVKFRAGALLFTT
jgi:hypothetical protein